MSWRCNRLRILAIECHFAIHFARLIRSGIGGFFFLITPYVSKIASVSSIVNIIKAVTKPDYGNNRYDEHRHAASLFWEDWLHFHNLVYCCSYEFLCHLDRTQISQRRVQHFSLAWFDAQEAYACAVRHETP